MIAAGERLHHAHDHVAKMRTRKQTEAMQQELSACTFAPQLHPAPDSLAKKPYVPLPERAAQLVKQKNAKLAQCATPNTSVSEYRREVNFIVAVGHSCWFLEACLWGI